MIGASSVPKYEINKGGMTSEDMLEEMRNEGKMIQQETRYVAGDNVFCVYNVDSEDLIKEHTERSGRVANEINKFLQ